MKEELLTDGLRRRDKVIFDYLFNYYYSALCVFAMKYIGDQNVVEDLVQDVFVTLWAEGPRLKINTSLKGYLFTSVRNRCLDTQKHLQTRESYRTQLLSVAISPEIPAENMLAESELRQIIQTSLEKLPPRCREIFILNRMNGFTNQEIASQLGISKRTVELQISNALKIMRRELAEYLPLLIIAWLLR